MIKIYCDNCKNENKDTDFFCEIQVKEKMLAIDSRTLKEYPQIRTLLLHFCQKCYNEKIKANEKKEHDKK